MNVIDLRMDNGLAEKKEDGRTIHVELEDVRTFYGDTVHYILTQRTGRCQIIEDNSPNAVIRRSIIEK
jgi:hypothetical protein